MTLIYLSVPEFAKHQLKMNKAQRILKTNQETQKIASMMNISASLLKFNQPSKPFYNTQRGEDGEREGGGGRNHHISYDRIMKE
jgi:hypothetical protein